MEQGFYERGFEAQEKQDLGEIPTGDLSSEIALLRVIIRRLLDRASEVESLDKLLALYRVIDMTCTCIGTLVRGQFTVSGSKSGEVLEDLSKILEDLSKETF